MSNLAKKFQLVVESYICIFKGRINIMSQLRINRLKVYCNKMRMKVYILEVLLESIRYDRLNTCFYCLIKIVMIFMLLFIN